MRILLLGSLLLSPFSLYAAGPLACDERSRATAHLSDVGAYMMRGHPRPEAIVMLEERLATLNGFKCKNKVWPDGKLTQTPIEIIDQESKKVYRFNPKTNKLEVIRATSTQDERAPLYDFHKTGDGGVTLNASLLISPPLMPPPPKESLCFAQKKTQNTFIKTNKPPLQQSAADTVTKVLAHENFHNVDQDPANPIHVHTGGCHWSGSSGDPVRDLGPGGDGAKFARQHIMLNLKRAIDARNSADRKAAMAQVKAWSKVMTDKYAELGEKLRGVDRAEGSAEYVGFAANAYGKLGCDERPEAMKEEARKYLNDRYYPDIQAPDQQAYLLGSAAGILLDEMGVKDWKEQVAKGKTPMEILLAQPELKSSPRQEPTEDVLLRTSAANNSAVTSCLQNAANGILDVLYKRPNDYVLVEMEKIPFGSSAGFFNVGSNGEVTAIPQAQAGGSLAFKEASMIGMSGVCSEEKRMYVLVPKSMIADDGKVSGTQGLSRYEGRAPAASGKEWNGVDVRCR